MAGDGGCAGRRGDVIRTVGGSAGPAAGGREGTDAPGVSKGRSGRLWSLTTHEGEQRCILKRLGGPSQKTDPRDGN